MPVGDVAPGVRTDCRISDHSLGSAALGLGVEPLGIETQQQHLVKPRAAAQRLRLRIHRPCQNLFAVKRQIVRLQWLRGCRGGDVYQQIALLRPLARRICLRQAETRRERQGKAQPERSSAPDPGAAGATPIHHFPRARSVAPAKAGAQDSRHSCWLWIPAFAGSTSEEAQRVAIGPTMRRYVASWSPIGRRRMRLPVAAKIALHRAGAKGGRPGSPTPLDGTSILFGTIQTCVIGGDSSMRTTWNPSKLFCSTRPFLKLISPYLARLSPIVAAPSICE